MYTFIVIEFDFFRFDFRVAGLSAKRNDWPIDTSGKAGLHVSRLQYDLYDCTELGNGEIYEKTICQIHMPFNELRHISKYIHCTAKRSEHVLNFNLFLRCFPN